MYPDPKMIMKMFRLAGLGLMLCGIGRLLTIYADELQAKEIKDLRNRVLTLEAQMLNLKMQNDIQKKKEEVDAE